MGRKEHIVSYADKDLLAMQQRGEDKSDWVKAAAMTDMEIEAAIASDEDEDEVVIEFLKKTSLRKI